MSLRSVYESITSLKQSTDKDTVHSYLDVYNRKFDKYENSATAVMEIGVMHGGSIRLWANFFKNATVHGVDIIYDQLMEKLDESNIILDTLNAYDINYVNTFPDNYFDIIVDDGPHSLESQLACIDLYFNKLKSGGVIAIEDIQSDTFYDRFIQTAEKYTSRWEIVDIRNVKGRYDDLMFFVYKD